MKKLNCIVVDDNEIDRLTVVAHVRNCEKLQLLNAFDTSLQAKKFLTENKPDVVFLDIDMPELSGIELRKLALEIPACIFITSHPEHAVESFDLDTLDFIVKPITKERFLSTVEKLENFFDIREKAQLYENSIGGNFIEIKEGYSNVKIKLHEIVYLEALKDYTFIYTLNKRHCILKSIGNVLKTSEFFDFIRIHRSFAIRKEYITKVSSLEIELNGKIKLPIGRNYKDNLLNRL